MEGIKPGGYRLEGKVTPGGDRMRIKVQPGGGRMEGIKVGG